VYLFYIIKKGKSVIVKVYAKIVFNVKRQYTFCVKCNETTEVKNVYSK